jgi:c(7)-type cytochrome triheme protein
MSARLLLVCALAAAAAVAQGAEPGAGKAVYDSACAACHNSGAAGAPKLGDAAAWQARFAGGIGALYRSAISGKGSMPPKGGQARLTAAEVEAAVNYMVLAADANAKVPVVAGRVDAKGAPPAAKPGAAAQPAANVPAAGASAAATAAPDAGAAVYARACAACHASDVAGAPKLGDAAAWAPKLKAGLAALQSNAVGGKGAMPPKGGNASLADADVRAAVAYMVDRAGSARGGDAASAPSSRAAAAAPAQVGGAPQSVAPPSAPPAAAAPAATPAAPAAVATAPPRAADASPNAFNRLLRSANRRNPPPHEDGIHDPSIEEVYQLQPPQTGLAGLPPSSAGNRIDWVKALNERKITPRFDRIDPQAQAAVMDLNIVREVKGSMPDVVYPHKQHTQWLDCANCHPAIFKPQKGANPMSMAAIMLGEQCGVCHGKVAFPVSECRLCHSKNKVAGAAAAAPR